MVSGRCVRLRDLFCENSLGEVLRWSRSAYRVKGWQRPSFPVEMQGLALEASQAIFPFGLSVNHAFG